ncbi:MAG TPA: glycosyltransferase family 4 protein, partial [Chloroflexi bacterium]|nr:glycosyltransferase family 4 protein [Chloroflexota bacterium]
ACRRLGRAGRAWVEARYDRSRMVTNTLAVYERFVREDA